MRTPATIAVEAYSARISDKTVWTFARVRDDEGRSGWGEATLQGQAPALHAHVERLAPSLIGQPARPSQHASTATNAADAAAECAVDQALWDLAAQAEGKSLAAMLGAPRRNAIALYANINRGTADRSPAGFAARALEVANRGFDAIKIAPFDDLRPELAGTTTGRKLQADGIARVAAVRDAIGPQRQLMVDCHWRLTEASALDVLRQLEPLRLYWLECPVDESPAMLPALRKLRARANAAGVRLAGCESMTGVAAFAPFFDVYDVIMPDVKYAGGLAEMLRIAEAAAAKGTACSPHNPTGPIAHMHSVHVSALLGELPFLELQYGESPLFFDLVDGRLPDPTHGASALPAGPGLGAALDMTELVRRAL